METAKNLDILGNLATGESKENLEILYALEAF